MTDYRVEVQALEVFSSVVLFSPPEFGPIDVKDLATGLITKTDLGLVVGVEQPALIQKIEIELADFYYLEVKTLLGPKGDQGVAGPQGEPGLNGAAGFIHMETVPSFLWVVNHNLGFHPSVEVEETGGKEVEAEVLHVSDNQTRIYFVQPTAGRARLI